MGKDSKKIGRPSKWENLEVFNKKASGFFEWCEGHDYIPDIEGLAVYMDTTRKTLFEYEAKPEFSNAIKKLKDKIFFNKKQLAFKNKINPTVFIFDAKNNHDYKDTQTHGFDTGVEEINLKIKK